MNKQSFQGSVAGIFVPLLVVAGAATAMAQEQIKSSRPALGGHCFTESVDVPSPFVRTYIRNRLGVGQYVDLPFAIEEIGGEPITGFQGSLVIALLDFEYQYAIKPWLAARGRFVMSGRLGTETMSLLSQGITMATGFELGWLIRLHEREKTALSLDLALNDRSFTGVNISRFVEDVIAGVPASLVRTTPSARGSAGLRFAWAASPLLGVSAVGETGYGESVERTRGELFFWRFSTALDFDLRTRISAPLGVAVGYTYDSFPEFGGDNVDGVQATFIRFSYLGRDDFLLSLDVSHDRIPLTGDRPDLKGVSLTVSLRYYI